VGIARVGKGVGDCASDNVQPVRVKASQAQRINFDFIVISFYESQIAFPK
jgi:hypothetical protein